MNRHQRRAAAAREKGDSKGKAKLVLHTPPEDAAPEHLALFLAAASQTYSAAKAIPGIEFPVHIAIEYGEGRVCGTVEPDDGTGGGEPFMVDRVEH